KGGMVTVILVIVASILQARNVLKGSIQESDGNPIEDATVSVDGTKVAISTDNAGQFSLHIPTGKTKLTVRAVGFLTIKKDIAAADYQNGIEILIENDNRNLEEGVVSGTSKQVSKLDSPIPVEVFTSKFFQANPAPTIFESLQNINDVLPQTVCSACN